MFGLSPGQPSGGKAGKKKTVLEVAYEQGRLDEPVFTAWLERTGRNCPLFYSEEDLIQKGSKNST